MCIRDSPRTTLRWGGPPGVRAWRRADGCADAGARRFGCGRPGADTWYGLSRDSSPHRATWHRPRPAPYRRSARCRERPATDPARRTRAPTGAAPAMRAVTRPRCAGYDRGTRSRGSTRMPDRHCSSRHGRRVRPRRASHVPAGVVRRRQPQCNAQFFLGVDNQFGALELLAQTSVVALQLLDLSCRAIRLRPPLFWRERRLIGPANFLAPGRNHGGVDALAPQERPERTGLLAALGLGEQPPPLASGEIAPPGDRHDPVS